VQYQDRTSTNAASYTPKMSAQSSLIAQMTGSPVTFESFSGNSDYINAQIQGYTESIKTINLKVKNITLNYGATFKPSAAVVTATDTMTNKNMTSSVKATALNTKKVGTQTVTYSVVDPRGHKSTVTGKVTVKDAVVSTTKMNTKKVVKNKTISIYKNPYLTYGNNLLAGTTKTKNIKLKVITIKERKKTAKKRTYYLIYNGSKKIGWIADSALQDRSVTIKKTNIKNKTVMTKKNYTLYDRAYTTKAKKRGTLSSKKLLKKNVRIVYKTKNGYGTYYKVYTVKGKYLGWVNYSAIY
jgi:hypothetical protein